MLVLEHIDDVLDMEGAGLFLRRTTTFREGSDIGDNIQGNRSDCDAGNDIGLVDIRVEEVLAYEVLEVLG